jgi:hypothetical protein
MNEDIISQLSPGPYEWAIFQEGPTQRELVIGHFDKGSGDVHAIWLPKHSGTSVGDDPERPEHAVLLCMTGNGPNSKSNAKALMAILNQRQFALDAKSKSLPIPTTPDCVAWAEYAIVLEHALGIADPIPEGLKNLTAEDIINYRCKKGTP